MEVDSFQEDGTEDTLTVFSLGLKALTNALIAFGWQHPLIFTKLVSTSLNSGLNIYTNQIIPLFNLKKIKSFQAPLTQAHRSFLGEIAIQTYSLYELWR